MSNQHFFAHPSTIIDDGAQIGQKTKIWHFCHVMPKAVIGSNCNIGQNVYIDNNVSIGNGVKIQNNVSVYANVIVEDDCFLGPSMVFTNVINPRAFVERKSEFKTTVVKKGSSIGANATIICGITIGQYAFIGAGAVVVKDIPDFALVVGNPTKQIGWMSEYGEQIPLPLTGEGRYTCPYTGQHYTLHNDNLEQTGV
jgi:UDP-2-acetamido-3-amino-2,3-dideoxy-glucuronate N-acetyltransferase